jgi:Type II secretion system (T2SS), protein E, N-terminal domain
MARKRIGELLIERKIITQAQLEAGLAAQQRTHQRLGLTLLAQGVLTEVQLAQVLAQSLSLSTVDLNQVQVDWSAVHMLRDRFCENHALFPFAVDGKGTTQRRLLVAMSDPSNQAAIEEIEFTTGLGVTPYVSTLGQVRAAILRYYHKGAAPKPAANPGTSKDEDPPMVVGEEIVSNPHTVPASKRKNSVAKDLDFLFGARTDDEGDVEKLERRFWALLRVLQRKGLLTKDEFLAELEREP